MERKEQEIKYKVLNLVKYRVFPLFGGSPFFGDRLITVYSKLNSTTISPDIFIDVYLDIKGRLKPLSF